MNKSEQLIACPEGEIAKRDEELAATVGEREAFDQWYREKKGLRESTDTTFINDAFFPYKAFQAGAAYQRQSGEYGDAYQGAREDLGIWKCRALEAEARVRQQDQIIDRMGEDLNAINGPTLMGEPVLPSERQSGVVVPHDLLIRVLEPVTSEQYINSKHELLALMREFARLNGAGSHE